MFKTVWFLGLVQGLGKVENITCRPGLEGFSDDSDYSEDKVAGKLWIKLDEKLDGVKAGDNLLVNGVCLTVQGVDGNVAEFSLWPQTILKTSLRELKPGDEVNLERNREKR
ncbi:MAG: hypothetical protein HPY50_06895 [Firmicutes bacterium]|nr:hypothetical protein [Bacillota bacterium]